MVKGQRSKNLLLVACFLVVFSCSGEPTEGNNLPLLGFYASPKEIIQKLGTTAGDSREHFMLGVAHKRLKQYKKAIFHFSQSCFTSARRQNLKLFAGPVFQFVKEFHIKSDYYDDAVYEIADLFYLYREFDHVVRYLDLISDSDAGLYRDAALLKSRALAELKRYDEAVSFLERLLPRYENPGSKAILLVRTASVLERRGDTDRALKEYFEVLKLDASSWHAEIALNRIQELLPKSGFTPDGPQNLLLAKSLYHHGKFAMAVLLFSEIRAATKPAEKDVGDVLRFLVKSSMRAQKRRDAETLIAGFKDNPGLQNMLLKVRADELWDMRKRMEAVEAYKILYNRDAANPSRESLERITQFMLERKMRGYDPYLAAFLSRYPKDASSEYFLWMMAREKIRGKSGEAASALEDVLSKFPSGRYSDWMRFWLHKIYASRGKEAASEKMVRELVAFNPDSSYTWLLLQRIQDRYDHRTLGEQFNTSVKIGNPVDQVFFHTLLFLKEKDFDRRDKRLAALSLKEVRSYEKLESELDSMSLGSSHGKTFRGLKKYFAVGYLEGINRALDVLPENMEVERDRNIALAHYGERYGNVYLSLWSTMELLRSSRIKENLYLMDRRTVRRLLPLPFRECVESCSAAYKTPKPLLYGVIKSESFFNTNVVSSAGAVGLMQLMPATARGIARELGLKEFDLKDPCTSIRFGAKYLAWLNKFFRKNLDEMMAGYNAGAGNVLKWKDSPGGPDMDYFVEFVPFDETRYYILRTRKNIMQYGLVY